MEIIARIHTDFSEKFGIPRQSGLVEELRGEITFLPPYKDPEAVRGLEEFEYIWLLWQFQEKPREHFEATVRPPRLGGNRKMGVFATRSPFRPNSIGLSSVRLLEIEYTKEGPKLIVAGADLRDQTPIYDIKPYLPYTDAHPGARAGFADAVLGQGIPVVFDVPLPGMLSPEKKETLRKLLEQDPRPGYQKEQEREYGMIFSGYNVRFRVMEGTLHVVAIGEASKAEGKTGR